MKKMTQTIAVILLVLIASVTLSACNLGGNPGPSDTSVEVGISMSGHARYQYDVGEEFDPNGAKVVVSYDDNTQKEIPLVESMITSFDTSTEGIKSYTITYKTFTLTRNYKVEASIHTTDGAIYSYHVTAGGEGYSFVKLDLTNNKLYIYSATEIPNFDTFNWDSTTDSYLFSLSFTKSYQEGVVLTTEWKNDMYDMRYVITSITSESIVVTSQIVFEGDTRENPSTGGSGIFLRYQAA